MTGTCCRCRSLSGIRSARADTTDPEKLCPTRITSCRSSYLRTCATSSMKVSNVGLADKRCERSPSPVRVGVYTECPNARKLAATFFQHHPQRKHHEQGQRFSGQVEARFRHLPLALPRLRRNLVADPERQRMRRLPFLVANPVLPPARQLRPPTRPRAITCAWISAAPSKML